MLLILPVARVRVPMGGVSVGVAPVAYQVILEAGIGQFREFEPPRVHTILVLIRGDFFLGTNCLAESARA